MIVIVAVMTLLCESQKCECSVVNFNALVNLIAVPDYCLVTAHMIHVGQTTRMFALVVKF